MPTNISECNRFWLGAPDILATVKTGKKPAKEPGKTQSKIAIVGAGRLGSTLAERLAEAGFTVTEILVRQKSRSIASARRVARKVGASVCTSGNAKLDAEIVWFCVPDSQIAAAAADLSRRYWKNKVALHSSGLLSSDVLAKVRDQGARVASVHPLMTFVEKSKPSLEGVPFAVEGDAMAVRVATSVVGNVGGHCFRIRKQNKIAYHAFATMVCPLLVSLLAVSEKVAGLAEIPARKARRLMMPILWQTLTNYEKLGAGPSFSGPIVRGDSGTIAKHLKSLHSIGDARSVYVALAGAALDNLPSPNREKIGYLLSVNPKQVRRRS